MNNPRLLNPSSSVQSTNKKYNYNVARRWSGGNK
jgi:hypothetical protein